jgi:hypothetical protein
VRRSNPFQDCGTGKEAQAEERQKEGGDEVHLGARVTVAIDATRAHGAVPG